VIGADVFAVEPWAVVERELHLELIAQTESLFALSNGHVGLRGDLDEGEPAGAPGSFLNGFYEVRPLPYAETAYGNPEAGQTMINATNGKLIRLLVDDEPFGVRYGHLTAHERRLDLREGILQREVEWASPAGQRARADDEDGLLRAALRRRGVPRGRAGGDGGAHRRAVPARGERARS
jgi:alpha,alpha-trehalose phosphorylase